MSTSIGITRSMNDNLTRVDVGDLTLWFSYETPVAYLAPGEERQVSENVWSATTSRHLNDIDGGTKEAKARRVPHTLFTHRLGVLMDSISFTTGATR
jgi:hypothetical protein